MNIYCPSVKQFQKSAIHNLFLINYKDGGTGSQDILSMISPLPAIPHIKHHCLLYIKVKLFHLVSHPSLINILAKIY